MIFKMRNKTAFIFVLLANILMMAHAAIPHHHHTEAPEEIAVECSHEEEHDHHHENLPVCNDDHEHGETTPCILTAATLVPNNQNRLNELLEQVIDSEILFYTLFVFNSANISLEPDFEIEVFEDIPLYSRLLVSSQGLRAPPVC